MKLAAILTLTALTGCAASMAEIDERPVGRQFSSAKTGNALVSCLVPAVSWMGVPAVAPDGEGRTRLTSDVSGVITLSMIVIDGNPSIIEVRTKVPDRLDRSVRSCI